MASVAIFTVRFHWLLFLVGFVWSAPPPKNTLRKFALEDLVPLKQEFFPESVTAEWISGFEFVYTDPGNGIKKYNVDDDSVTTFLTEQELANLNHSVASFGNNGQFLLISSDVRRVYRYSSIARYTVFDMTTRKLYPLADGQHIQTFAWAGGPSLAYVRKNNVFYVPDVRDPQTTLALTSDGVPGEVYNGHADWIYEEEIFNSAKAMWFSPQGSYLAVATFNDTLVESATYPIYGNPATPEYQYPHLIRFKYPKAGRTNPAVSLNVFPTTNPWEYKPIIKIPVPSLVGPDHILGSVDWANDKVVMVQWLNRRQNVSVLMACDVVTAICEKKQTRNEPKGWIDINDMFFDPMGTRMVDISPVQTVDDRHYHAVVHSLTDNFSQDLTPGYLTVRSILAWNHDTDTVFYTMSSRSAPWKVQLWSSTINDVNTCLSCDLPDCKYATAVFAPGAKHAIILCSAAFNPTHSFVFNTKAKTFKPWANNDKLKETLTQYEMPTYQYKVAELPSGSPVHIRLMLPPHMLPNMKYPMVLRVYAGPGSSRVSDTYEVDYSTYLATNRSFIVCSVDVRGSGVMGISALHAVNRALGTVEVDDTLEAIRYLLKNYSFIDSSRVAVWGWSYGGYVSAMMLAHDNDTLLRCAASVAPVTSWIYYDSIYTERYMDVPTANLAGYERSDLLLQASKLQGRRLLLVHGNADDNVHYQHSMLLSKVLQHDDIEFEQMSYPDERHSLLGVSRHFYHTLDRYWTECFQAKPNNHTTA